MRPQVAIGLLGTTLDRGLKPSRWERWRPSVDLCRHDDLVIDRFELLHIGEGGALLDRVVEDIGVVSPETTVRPHRLDVTNPWDFESVFAALHDFSLSTAFDPEVEDYLVHVTTGTHVAQICSFLLTESRHFPARLVQSSPPSSDDPGGPGSYSLIDLDLSRFDRIASRFAEERLQSVSFLKSGIETRNPAFNALIDEIETVALRSVDPVLLLGPTGAGKSRLARRMYELKRARGQVLGRFVEVNCATLRGEHAMSALFGHVRGAFTGADRDREGLLRGADGGVLFLDELGELGPDEQAMLLRAIEQKSFLPVGADTEVQSDFQLVAGTNRDLSARLETGAFREDLLARVNLWTFELPGLAERVQDIGPNVDFELAEWMTKTGTRVTFNAEARAAFEQFAATAPWPGNFRDFNAAITRMATLSEGGRITVDTVRSEQARLSRMWGGSAKPQDELQSVLDDDALDALDRFDRTQLADVIAVCRSSKTLSSAGRTLFAESRKKKKVANDADRLRKYLSKFGLVWADVAQA